MSKKPLRFTPKPATATPVAQRTESAPLVKEKREKTKVDDLMEEMSISRSK